MRWRRRPLLAGPAYEEDRRDRGDRSDRDREDAGEDAVVSVVRDDERPDEEAGADERGHRREARGCAAGSLAKVAERAEREEDRAVEREEQADGDPGRIV